jgi:indole-3-glycerol phosphate synthase/phosphoribosylanthranilate isomerase
MTDVLAAIVQRKRSEVAARLAGRPVDATSTQRSLRAALGRPGARFIMEVKRASPSGHRSAVTVDRAVRAYAPVADAISVLTDGPGFGGSLDDLRMARRLFDGPILAKDFIVNIAQVGEARAAGADAVLAMMSVLDDITAAAVLSEARRHEMDAIVEVRDEAELGRALALGATIVGVNNRDLKTLRTDLSATERLAPLVPADVLVISESGIGARTDVERLAPIADAFLVGSSLMAAPDITEAARALVHGRVKLCGLTQLGDVELVARSGATHAGLILVEGSPRFVNFREASRLSRHAQGLGIKSVGVFRDCPPETVRSTALMIGLDAVQLHGSESDAEIAAMRAGLPEAIELWAACGVGTAAAPRRAGADRTLFDNRGGGTGNSFDWALVVGREDLPSAFLAGGIGAANAESACKVGAYGLDVGSSVEAAPGIKDAAKVEALFAALRPAARSDA